MRGHSTVHQLIEIYHNICLSLENREVIWTVFCDISKAFNKVWHRDLLKQIKSLWNFREFAALIENYLSDRNQKVALQNSLSEVWNIKGGVPQGSVLEPLLFILYINDITDDIQILSRLCPDDTSLSYSSSNKKWNWTKIKFRYVKKLQFVNKMVSGFSPPKN